MNLTPAMQQYYDMKEQNKDAILFFRMGDFYEMFDDDAIIANKVLGIAITTRNKNATEPTPLAGIPYHAKEKYLPLFIEAGYKVAIAEQVSDPKLKGIVQREVVRIVSPATLSLESEDYDVENSIIISIAQEGDKYAISIIDIEKHKWETCEFDTFEDLLGLLFKISPKEVVLSKDLFGNQKIRETLEKKYSLNIYFYAPLEPAYEYLLEHFGTTNLLGFGIEKYKGAIKASALLLEYLKVNQKESFDFLDSLSYKEENTFLKLDESTIKNLDLVFNLATNSKTEGTLFGVLDNTKTTMGRQFLYENILQPLANIEEIEKRQNFIEELIQDPMLLDSIQKELRNVSNIYNILNRLSLNRALPRDLLALKKSLISIQNVFQIIEEKGSENLKKLL